MLDKKLFLGYFLLLSSLLFSQKGMEIQISAKKVEAGEPLMVVYALSNYNERGMMRKGFEPFELIGGPQVSRSMNTSYINGVMTSSQTNSYTIYLACKKMGKFQVPKQSFQLSDGSIVDAQAIEIEVVKLSSVSQTHLIHLQPLMIHLIHLQGNHLLEEPSSKTPRRQMVHLKMKRKLIYQRIYMREFM